MVDGWTLGLLGQLSVTCIMSKTVEETVKKCFQFYRSYVR